MDYVGEHLLPGKLGQFFVVLSFAASFVATLSYFKSANAKSLEDQGLWKRMARFAFCINAISIFIIFATIYYIVRKHYFEYNFALEHGFHNVSRWMTWLPISLKNAAKCDKWYQLQNHSITESLNAKGAWEKLFTSHPRACRISVSNKQKSKRTV